MTATQTTRFEVGSLVRARGREWVVLPQSTPKDHLLVLRPLGGAEDEVTGIYTRLEAVEPAEFALPDPARDLGSDADGALLRDAVRLGFQSAAGPFRCLAGISITPRPYQLVPLLMALRLDPVRMLIADDVGIGKTIESLLIARELWDRGEVTSICVLCPPHLAEQWQRALRDQFHLDATLVLAGTARSLERKLAPGESLFERHRVTVISLDWIKDERRGRELLRVCPELIIVDEAHTCTANGGVGRSAQKRHELLRQIAARKDQHMLLVTATPHSGKEDDFRSLLGLIDPTLAELPTDLSGEKNRRTRERLARHLVQRRRGDIVSFLGEHTNFPRRESSEHAYTMAKDYRAYLDKVLEYCREQVASAEGDERRQRIRWWSALALLRSIGSSPAAAAATLRNRAASAEAPDAEAADRAGERAVLDQDTDATEAIDTTPGSIPAGESESDALSPADVQRLQRLAREAEALGGRSDKKLADLTKVLKALLNDGHAPIVFCRFIPTVDYVVDTLQKKLKNVHVEGVTGTLPPDERERRVEAIATHPARVLVCTDCLSEGINLQDGFDTVIHYDLAWNPTRHEQREGRVDRYGQHKPVVRTLSMYGSDNPVDGIVLDVLLRKHQAIQKQLGITVPVPSKTGAVVQALMEGLMLRRGGTKGSQQALPFLPQSARELDLEWTSAAEREKASRSLFAQQSIKVDDVRRELNASRQAMGDTRALEDFVRNSLGRLQVPVSVEQVPASDGQPATARTTLDLTEAPAVLREALSDAATGVVPAKPLHCAFAQPVPDGASLLTRTSSLVRGLASHVLEAALDPLAAGELGSPARRLGCLQTHAVSTKTTLLLLRLRFQLTLPARGGGVHEQLAEEAVLVAFTGRAKAPAWLSAERAEDLLSATPCANTADDIKRHHLGRLLDRFSILESELERIAADRAELLLQAHRRVRSAAKGLHVRGLAVEPHLPVDLIGAFIYLPPAS